MPRFVEWSEQLASCLLFQARMPRFGKSIEPVCLCRYHRCDHRAGRGNDGKGPATRQQRFLRVGSDHDQFAQCCELSGNDTITNLVLVAEAFSRFTPGKRVPQSVCEQIQRDAQCVATIAGRLPIEPKLRDLTITSALLHDIGRLVLASKLPDQFCSVLSRASERKCQPFEAEEELLGTSHAEIGSYLLGLWGLPYLATEAVAHHHRPTRIPHSGLDISVALYLADWLAHESTVSPDSASACPLLLESDRACLEALGVLDRLPEFRELAQQCQAQNPGLHS